MTKQVGISILLLLLLLVVPAIADTSTVPAYGVSQYSVTTSPGNVIYEILVDPVPMGINQSHYLNYNGAQFLLTVGTAQSWTIYHDFDISLTYPNGTVFTNHERWIGVSSGSYKLDIQPVYYHAQSLNPTFAVYVNVGLNPLKTEFNTMTGDAIGDPLSSNILAVNAIPFTTASGSLGAVTNVFVYEIPQQEFKDHISTFDPYGGLSELGNTIFQWAWASILGFLNMIPVIGPLMITFISIAGGVLTQLIFWLSFLVANFWGIVLGIETLILMMAAINAKRGKKIRLGLLAGNIYNYNVAMVHGFVWVFDTARVWLVSIIDTITNIVNGLKPI